MTHIRYLTHPQVLIDPETPVPLWGLSDAGRDRAHKFAKSALLSKTTQIISSAERKAVETAQPIAVTLGISLEIHQAMHENDRSATGYLAPDEFEKVANQFFAQPSENIRGWERAIDAQVRIVREVETVLERNLKGDILFVGHGAVGTLLFCHYAKITINRAHDQPAGGGHYFTFLKEQRRILHPWKSMVDSFPCGPTFKVTDRTVH
jgi:broad specificity phosphatase PhoE